MKDHIHCVICGRVIHVSIPYIKQFQSAYGIAHDECADEKREFGEHCMAMESIDEVE